MYMYYTNLLLFAGAKTPRFLFKHVPIIARINPWRSQNFFSHPKTPEKAKGSFMFWYVRHWKAWESPRLAALVITWRLLGYINLAIFPTPNIPSFLLEYTSIILDVQLPYDYYFAFVAFFSFGGDGASNNYYSNSQFSGRILFCFENLKLKLFDPLQAIYIKLHILWKGSTYGASRRYAIMPLCRLNKISASWAEMDYKKAFVPVQIMMDRVQSAKQKRISRSSHYFFYSFLKLITTSSI